MTVNRPHYIFGIPNIITISRMVITPLFVIMLLKGKFRVALFVFAIAGISDGLDGLIARYFNQRTVLGAHLDPVADKLLLISAFTCLSMLQVIPGWIAAIVIFREVLIVLGILVLLITNRHFKVNPSFLSKCNTAMQILIVFESLLILVKSRFYYFHDPLCWITIMLTFLSGVQYACIWFDILRRGGPDLGVDG